MLESVWNRARKTQTARLVGTADIWVGVPRRYAMRISTSWIGQSRSNWMSDFGDCREGREEVR
jgi:hypothetical protein